MSALSSLQRELDTVLNDHAPALDTVAVPLGHAILGETEQLLSPHLDAGPWLVVCDANTWRVAGQAVDEALSKAGRSSVRLALDVPGNSVPLTCDDELVKRVQSKWTKSGCSSAIAVGSGTINDAVKLAAYRLNRPMAVVATAPSMNGYTSKIAAVLSDGVKTTIPCSAPLVVIADIAVLADAPSRMIASGFGDLLSKPVSNADWQLSAALNQTPHSPEAMAIIERGSHLLEGVAPGLAARDPDALAALTVSLMLSGFAMSVAGSSSPASGGEHLISHYIDMTGHALNLPYDFHGCQVGVGTLTTAWLYEQLQEFDFKSLDIDQRVAALPSWPDYAENLRARFGSLYSAVAKHARLGYPDRATLQGRLTHLVDQHTTILTLVQRTLRSSRSLESQLRSAQAPTRFSELGITRARAREAILWSKDIRNRYTVLHLAWELGMLERWSDGAVERFY